MFRALELADQALFRVSPNPRVGCVLAAPDGRILGEGSTQLPGGAHAEVMALRDAFRRGHSTSGATAYVTLEPCAHHGRTGPCCEALVKAGIRRVVSSLPDPNPQVGGHGFAYLRAQGVEVDIGDGARGAFEQNIGFFSRFIRQKPWVRLKVAASADGQTALTNGVSQWITSPQARQDGYHYRARSCAVMTGIGTVLADNPRLNVRDLETPRQPHLIVLDSLANTPLLATLFDTPERQIWIYTGSALPNKIQALRHRGADVRSISKQAVIGPTPTPRQAIDLQALMKDLVDRQINELHVEAGATLNGALLLGGWVDEIVLYLAPTFLGLGRNMFALPILEQLPQSPAFDWVSAHPVGPDLKLVLRARGAADALFQQLRVTATG
jgi:diaminohydroxyphosphoribosylaminopyrimidine deaminase / 5-amino-6-(5-phosphoribosylamino)uracil reductase